MGSHSLPSLSPLSLLHHQRPSSSSSLFFFTNPSSFNLSTPPLSPKPFTARSTNLKGDQPTNDGPSSFLDEDGVVDDMDGYLNYLSLEYDSVWDTKPSWCQPWTILLTGVIVVVSSWLILHSGIISGGVLFLICAWWYIFLYAYPKEYSNMIAERRKKVTNGVEDTFGLKKSQ